MMEQAIEARDIYESRSRAAKIEETVKTQCDHAEKVLSQLERHAAFCHDRELPEPPPPTTSGNSQAVKAWRQHDLESVRRFVEVLMSTAEHEEREQLQTELDRLTKTLQVACSGLRELGVEIQYKEPPGHKGRGALMRKLRRLELFLHRDLPEELDRLAWSHDEISTMQGHGLTREAPVPGVAFDDELHLVLGEDTTREGVELPAGSVLSCAEPGYYMMAPVSMDELQKPTFILRKATVILVTGASQREP